LLKIRVKDNIKQKRAENEIPERNSLSVKKNLSGEKRIKNIRQRKKRINIKGNFFNINIYIPINTASYSS
jgi:hypothetical protein